MSITNWFARPRLLWLLLVAGLSLGACGDDAAPADSGAEDGSEPVDTGGQDGESTDAVLTDGETSDGGATDGAVMDAAAGDAGPECTAAADCGADTECRTFACTDSACMTTDAPAMTACTEGGEFCDGMGACLAGSCMDSVQGGDETDVDCGGSCAPCANDAACDGDADCESALCVDGTCTACATSDDCGADRYCDEAMVCQGTLANGAACASDMQCGSGVCADGVCCDGACDGDCVACNLSGTEGVCTPLPNDTACTDDGAFCNGTESCQAGVCASAGDPCGGADGDADCRESCDEGADACTAPDPAGSACDDGLFCTGADTCDAAGACVSAGNPCPGTDGDGDCSESCNEASDACDAPDEAGTACNDGLFCTASDVCNAGGFCVGTGDPCPGPNGDGDCSETCNEASDACDGNDPAGSACNDSLFCTVTDRCNAAGACVGTGDPCVGSDGDRDCSESCSEADRACTGNDPEGSFCDDGRFCTGTDSCRSGVCVSAGNPCPGADGDSDCSEMCNESSDRCNGNDPDGSSCGATRSCSAGMCVAITNKIAFITSGTINTNAGSLAAYDAHCQAHANSAGLPGTYMAWVSTDSQSPSTRFTRSTNPYVLPSGRKIADNWADLTDNSLDAPLNETQTGASGGGSSFGNAILGSTRPDGTSIAGFNCNGWTTTNNSLQAQYGDASQTNHNWSVGWGLICGQARRIYCFQQ